MTTLNVNTIKPAGATLNLGESGDSVVLADDVKVNLVKDVGANTLWSSNGSGVVSSVATGIGGADKLLATTTVTLGSSVASVAFTSGIDSTYKEYVFVGINVHLSGLGRFEWIPSDDGGSSYGMTITSTGFVDVHYENNASYGVSYDPAYDLAQQSIAQPMAAGHEIVNDANIAFRLHLFNPASTTYVKNFYAYAPSNSQHPGAYNARTAGYINTTAAINAIKFVPVTGNVDAGIFKLDGIAS